MTSFACVLVFMYGVVAGFALALMGCSLWSIEARAGFAAGVAYGKWLKTRKGLGHKIRQWRSAARSAVRSAARSALRSAARSAVRSAARSADPAKEPESLKLPGAARMKMAAGQGPPNWCENCETSDCDDCPAPGGRP